MSNIRHSITLNPKKHQDYVISILFEEYGAGRSFGEFIKDILYELGMKNCKMFKQKGLVALKPVHQEQSTNQSSVQTISPSKVSNTHSDTGTLDQEIEEAKSGNEEPTPNVTLDDVMNLKIT